MIKHRTITNEISIDFYPEENGVKENDRCEDNCCLYVIMIHKKNLMMFLKHEIVKCN